MATAVPNLGLLIGASDPIRAIGSGRGWVGIVANAGSGLGRGRGLVAGLIQALGARGFEPRVCWTLEDRAKMVADAVPGSGCRCLVAVGGDGTVSALVNELPKVPITVLPAGTENLFARQFGMKSSPERTAATIEHGKIIKIDLGSAPFRRFTLMAGVGFDADVVTRHHLARIGKTGVASWTHRAAYVLPVLLSSFHYRFPPLTVQIDEQGAKETLEGSTAFVFNLPQYALGLPLAPAAQGNDGLLDLIVFRHAGPWRMLRYLWLVFRGIHLDQPDVQHRRIGSASFTCPESVPVQLDGDPGGRLEADRDQGGPWTIKVLPAAVEVVLPPSEQKR